MWMTFFLFSIFFQKYADKAALLLDRVSQAVIDSPWSDVTKIDLIFGKKEAESCFIML